MLDHKRDYCKLRFTCKCDVLNEESCTSCDLSATDLMNLNCSQGSHGDSTTTDSAVNVTTSNKTLSETSVSTVLSTSSYKGERSRCIWCLENNNFNLNIS